jgi:hypothetical protein
MRNRGGIHFLGALLTVGLVGVLMALAYLAGGGDSCDIGSGARHCLGFLFAVLVVVLVGGLLCRARGCYAYGPWDRPDPRGPGGWHGHVGRYAQECRESAKSALDEWHRQAHADEAANSGTPAGDSSSQPGEEEQ